MTESIQNKVEGFLSGASYISFVIKEEFIITFLYDKNGYEKFSQKNAFNDLIRYWKGRKIALVIVTNDINSSISLVDTHNLDTLKLEGPKFVNGNIHQFFEANLPTDTIFQLTIFGKSADNETVIIPKVLLDHKPLKIHGYSVIDKRSTQ